MKKRLVYIDVMRVFAMLLVILAHACAAVLGTHQGNWRIANDIVIVTEMAVPLFFMISGAMLMNSKKTYSLEYLFKHRLTRVVVPFLIWSVISAFGNSMIDTHDHINVVNSLLNMYHQPVLIAYWFIYPLITLYLLSPLLKAMVDHVSDTVLTYGLVLILIFVIGIPTLAQSLPKEIGTYFMVFPRSQMIVYDSIGYFLLGYRLTREKHQRIDTWMNLLLLVVLVAAKIEISYFTDNKSLQFLNVFSALILPFVTILMFTTLRSLENHYPKWMIAIVEFIAPLTYGVYLVHGLTIFTLQKYLGYSNYWLIFLLTTIISLAIIWILHSIPFVRRLFT